MSPRKKKMKLYTVHVEMDDLCCPVWREVTIPSILVLPDVYRIILEAFGWDDESCYQFQFKKGSYIGNQEKSLNEITRYISLESKPVGNETLEEVLGNSKVFNLVFVSEDLWCSHATVIKRESADMDLFPFKCLAGEGACPSSLFESTSLFNEAYMIMTDPQSDPDAKEEVDAFLKENDLYVNGQWPGKFDLDAANRRLDDLKERIKDEIKDYLSPPEGAFDEAPNVGIGIAPSWTSAWMEDDSDCKTDSENADKMNAVADDDAKTSELKSSLFNSLVELCDIHGIPYNNVDFSKRDFRQFDLDALFKALKKSPNPVMHIILDNLKTLFEAYDSIDFMEDDSENNPAKDKKKTAKKAKSKKTSSSKKKQNDDKDDK